MLSVLQSRAIDPAGPLIEKFATSAGRWLGWLGVGVGVAMIVLDPLSGDTVNVSVVLVGVAVACMSWVVLVRPRVSVHQRGLLMQNMTRDISIPWRRIERCQVGQTLVVSTTEAEKFHGLGVTRSARTQMREQYGTTSMMFNFGGRATGRRLQQDRGPSVSRGEWEGNTYMSYVESRVAGMASSGERGSSGDPADKPVVAWAPLPVGLVGVSLLCLLVAFL